MAGLLLGVLIAWLVRRRPRAEVVTDLSGEPPTVPEGVSAVLEVLTSSAVVVGPHDEVLEATVNARTQGLARGSRIAVPELLDLVRRVRREQVIESIDLELLRGSRGARMFLTARVAPLAGDLIVILADDLTAARRIEQTRRDFVANISHELKTPIGAISLLSEAVEDAADDPEAVRKFASRMSVESARLNDLVVQVIELSRLQADDPLGNPEEVDIDEMIAEAVDRCQVDAEQHGVTLTVAGATGCRVLGNGRQRKSYLYIGDCLDAILLAMTRTRGGVEVYNLGTSEYCEVNDSIGWITEWLGLTPTLEYGGGERGWNLFTQPRRHVLALNS